MLSAERSESRPFCYRCGRPASGCCCAAVPRVDNRTPVYILQHPRERFHPFGSVRLAKLGLSKVSVDTFGEAFAHRRSWSTVAPPGAALLYPGAEARELKKLAESERPSSLVVIDGTWPHSRSILRQVPWLGALPRVRVRPASPGLYRIRREPRPECMSTLEAIVRALELLEPETYGLEALLGAFTGMIDRHLELRRAHPYDPYRRRR
jgi:DTW domain-containing protein YfiP